MAIHNFGHASVHPRDPYSRGEVCRFFLQGRCNRDPCRFLHPTTNDQRPPVPAASRGIVWRNPNLHGAGAACKKGGEHDKIVPTAGTGVDSSSFLLQSSGAGVGSPPVVTTAPGSASIAQQAYEWESSALAVKTVVEQGFSSPTVSCEIDARDAMQDVVFRDVGVAGATQEPYSRQHQLLKKVRPCSFFLKGSNCEFVDTCRKLHSWSIGVEDFLLVAALDGYGKPVTGIALPPNSNDLYTSSSDTVTTWDCPTGQRVSKINQGCEVSCLVGDGGWVFLGLPGVIKAWNSETKANLFLDYYSADRQVNALVIGTVNGDNILFAGLYDGSILAWRWTPSSNTFEPDIPATSAFAGAHSLGILTLVVDGERLYSGSMDRTIKVWLLPTLKCLQTLTDHSGAVTSIICFGKYLLSGSLDETVKIWGFNGDSLQVIYTHNHDARVVALGGISDASKTRHVLMCSCDDSTVYLYDLPSFAERGRIFSREEVTHIVTGRDGFFFIGNAAGDSQVWRWNDGSAN